MCLELLSTPIEELFQYEHTLPYLCWADVEQLICTLLINKCLQNSTLAFSHLKVALLCARHQPLLHVKSKAST